MFDVLTSPLDAIQRAKKNKSMKDTLLLLLVASVFLAIAVLLQNASFNASAFQAAGLTLVLGFAGTAFMALLLQLSLHILTTKGGYFEALTTLTYGMFITSCGMLAASVVGLLSMAGQTFAMVGAFLGGLVLLFALIMSYSVSLKAGMELFNTDILTVVIAILIVHLSVLVSMYTIIAQYMATMMTQTAMI